MAPSQPCCKHCNWYNCFYMYSSLHAFAILFCCQAFVLEVGCLSVTFLWWGFARIGDWGWLLTRGLGLDLINWLVMLSSWGRRGSLRCFQGVRKLRFCRLGAKPCWRCLWLQTWWDPWQSHPDWPLAPFHRLMDSAASRNYKSTATDYWHMLEPIFVWILYLSN